MPGKGADPVGNRLLGESKFCGFDLGQVDTFDRLALPVPPRAGMLNVPRLDLGFVGQQTQLFAGIQAGNDIITASQAIEDTAFAADVIHAPYFADELFAFHPEADCFDFVPHINPVAVEF